MSLNSSFRPQYHQISIGPPIGLLMMAMMCFLPSSPMALILMQKNNFVIIVVKLLLWISQHKDKIIPCVKKRFKIYYVFLLENINNFRHFHNNHKKKKKKKKFEKTFQKIIFDLEPWIVVVATILISYFCCGLSCKHLCFFIECDK